VAGSYFALSRGELPRETRGTKARSRQKASTIVPSKVTSAIRCGEMSFPESHRGKRKTSLKLRKKKLLTRNHPTNVGGGTGAHGINHTRAKEKTRKFEKRVARAGHATSGEGGVTGGGDVRNGPEEDSSVERRQFQGVLGAH